MFTNPLKGVDQWEHFIIFWMNASALMMCCDVGGCGGWLGVGMGRRGSESEGRDTVRAEYQCTVTRRTDTEKWKEWRHYITQHPAIPRNHHSLSSIISMFLFVWISLLHLFVTLVLSLTVDSVPVDDIWLVCDWSSLCPGVINTPGLPLSQCPPHPPCPQCYYK